MVMLVILVMGGAAFLVSSLSTTALKTARQEKTAEALAQAREALIGRAAKDENMPGSLPCPDTDNDGSAELLSGNVCPSYIGRLPWRTLKLPDLRDESGERLWYVLSTNFRDDNSAQPLNSNSQGQLSITGNLAMGNVAAIVIAPGAPLCGKSHNSNSASDYLEAGDGSSTSYALRSFSNDCTSSPYNDNLVAITSSQLFQNVERLVGNEFKRILNTYFAAWGAFPFAAPFADPSDPLNFAGQAFPAKYEGLLPIGTNVMPTWAAAPSISFSGVIIGSMGCILSNGSATGSRWRCCNLSAGSCTGANVTIPSGVTVTITGTLNNVGQGLWRPHNINDVLEVRARNIAGVTVPVTDVLDNVTIANNLNANGSATIVFSAQAKPAGTTLQRIELRDIKSYATAIAPSTTPVIPTWLSNNSWHQVAYYAVSPGYAPGGGNACVPLPGAPSCLTLNGSGGGNSKHAVIVMTSDVLSGQSRSANPLALCPATGTTLAPSACISNYLELENAFLDTLPDDNYIYENKTRSSTFNDQVVVVAP